MKYITALILACFSVFSTRATDETPVDFSATERENIEWSISYAYHLTDAQKDYPRVLMIGDSICNFYKDKVMSYLSSRMTATYWVSSFCVASPLYETNLRTHLAQSKYDVIHFNNGLHSLGTDPVARTNALRRTVALIRELQPQARLVWCTTTPTTDATKTAKVETLNAAARVVLSGTTKETATQRTMSDSALGPIRVDDLFTLMNPLARSSYWIDEVHPNEAGKTVEGARVAASIYHACVFPPPSNAVEVVYQPFVTTESACLFKNVQLADLYDFHCVIWGSSTTIRPGTGFCTANDGTTAEVQFRSFDSGTIWCVKLRLEQKGSDVYGQAVYAKYALDQPNINFDFDQGGNVMGSIATSPSTTGYGACEVTARVRSSSGLTIILAHE